MRAARALLGVDQKQLVEMSGASQPTIQRTEAREGNVCGVIDTLTKVIEAFECAGIYLMGENARSEVADAESASGTQPRHQVITPSDQKQNYGTATAGPGMILPLKRHKTQAA